MIQDLCMIGNILLSLLNVNLFIDGDLSLFHTKFKFNYSMLGLKNKRIKSKLTGMKLTN